MDTFDQIDMIGIRAIDRQVCRLERNQDTAGDFFAPTHLMRKLISVAANPSCTNDQMQRKIAALEGQVERLQSLVGGMMAEKHLAGKGF